VFSYSDNFLLVPMGWDFLSNGDKIVMFLFPFTKVNFTTKINFDDEICFTKAVRRRGGWPTEAGGMSRVGGLGWTEGGCKWIILR
jgi:hypothetical protein